MIHYIPKKYLEEWTRDNPVQAVIVVLFGLGMVCFVIYLFISDWVHGL